MLEQEEDFVIGECECTKKGQTPKWTYQETQGYFACLNCGVTI